MYQPDSCHWSLSITLEYIRKPDETPVARNRLSTTKSNWFAIILSYRNLLLRIHISKKKDYFVVKDKHKPVGNTTIYTKSLCKMPKTNIPVLTDVFSDILPYCLESPSNMTRIIKYCGTKLIKLISLFKINKSETWWINFMKLMKLQKISRKFCAFCGKWSKRPTI